MNKYQQTVNHSKVQLTEKSISEYTDNTENSFDIIRNETLDFSNNPKEALKWSNQNFPEISVLFSNEELSKIGVINTQLREKYLNRSELYQGDISLEKINQQFITETTDDIILYGDFTTENFGIVEKDFIENNEIVLESLLKETEYGIDNGYFLGSLSSKPPTLADKECIQMKLSVPKGTKMIRIGSLLEPKYMLQRESAFYYTGKVMYKMGVSLLNASEKGATWMTEKGAKKIVLIKPIFRVLDSK